MQVPLFWHGFGLHGFKITAVVGTVVVVVVVTCKHNYDYWKFIQIIIKQ